MIWFTQYVLHIVWVLLQGTRSTPLSNLCTCNLHHAQGGYSRQLLFFLARNNVYKILYSSISLGFKGGHPLITFDALQSLQNTLPNLVHSKFTFLIHFLKETIKIKEKYIIADPCLSSMSLTVHISVSLLLKSLRLSNSLKQRWATKENTKDARNRNIEEKLVISI